MIGFCPVRRRSGFALLLCALLAGCGNGEVPSASVPESDLMTERRHRMVEEQIKRRRVKDPRVLEAMRTIPRHRFVPLRARDLAYSDHPLPIGEGQTISQPYIVAFMTEALGVKPEDKILEIGTGSGYQAAVLGALCREVYSIEIVESLGLRAKALLEELGMDTIHVRIGDGYKGWPEQAPFDAVIVTCAPGRVPQPLVDQLREGGRMIIPVGNSYAQKLILLTKKNGKLRQKDVLPVMFVPMLNPEGERY